MCSLRPITFYQSREDFYHLALTYDRNSNILSADDSVHAGFDVAYTMDNLNRLTVAEEGTLSGGSIASPPTRKQEWTLTQTGNWTEDKLDLNGDGDWGDTNEWKDAKTFNKVNEIGTRDLDSTPGTTGDNHTLVYDPAGNLTSDPSSDVKYEWDAFYRLRKVKKQDGTLVAEYRYNALGFRIGVLEDTDLDSDVDGSDLWYYAAYDERWRMVAERQTRRAMIRNFESPPARRSGIARRVTVHVVLPAVVVFLCFYFGCGKSVLY